MEHFSIHHAASLLERTERTVRRAMKDTHPDLSVRGQPRWKMSTIVAALNRNADRPASSHNNDNGNAKADFSSGLRDLYARLDAACDKMRALPTLAARRAMTINQIVPLMVRAQRAREEFGKDIAEDANYTELHLFRLHFLYARGFEQPCKWTLDEALTNTYCFVDDDEDKAETT